MTRPNTRSKGRETESGLDAAATRAANKEDDRPDSRKKKKQRKQKESKNKDEVEEKERDKGERYQSQPLPLPRGRSKPTNPDSLGLLDDLLNYVPTRPKGGSPTPGLVFSAEEVEEASSFATWEEMELSDHFPNLRAFFTPEIKAAISPGHKDYFPRMLDAITSQHVVLESCFGGDENSKASFCLLLGRISHTRKTTPMLQLEEILEIFRHISPDHADLSGAAVQKLWIRDPATSLVDPKRILDSLSGNFSDVLAPALVQPCIDAWEAGADIFGLNLTYPRCILFLGPSGRGTLRDLQELFELAPFGDLKVDASTQSLFNSGDWTTTELYAEMLEHHLCHLDNTVKGMAQSEEGWALQPVIPRLRDASMKDLAFYIQGITAAIRARKPHRPRKRDQDDKGHASSDVVSSTKGRKVPSWATVPASETMSTRDRRPKKRTVEMEPLPGAASTSGGGADSEGRTAGERARPMTPAERKQLQRELADDYANPEGTSALDPAKLKALVQGKGDDTRYDKRLNAPAPGGKAHFRTLVRSRGRELGIALSDEQIDYLIERKLARVNFNLYEHHTASLKLEENQKKQKDQLPAQGFTTLGRQFECFEELFGLVVGPTEAAAIVTFWRREFNGMRVKGCVDWSTAYTLWRNMLVDYEVRWSEWNPQLHHPPTMWDWQNHTQETWETMRGRATFVLDKSLMHLWDTRPDIIAQVSTSEAATADPKDTSAFVSRPSPLDVLAAPAGRKVKQSKHKKSRSIKPKRAQGGPGTESEDSSEEDESEESSEEEDSESEDDDDDQFGKPCCNKRGKPYKKCGDCPFFAKHKVCKFYHADAPVGTTGAKPSLSAKSNKLLKRLGAFKSRRRR